MSTDLAKTSEPAKPVEPKSMIVANERGLQLASLDEMWRASTAFFKSGLFVKTHDSIEKTFVALQCGAEVGLPPVQALMSIAVINGRPTMWGDALPGLVWASGLCEGIVETIEGTGDNRTARCVAKRKGAGEIVGTFSMGDAKRAGLLGKGTWSSYPDRMLKTRARAFALRDGFADVLRGLQVREEVEDFTGVVTGEVVPTQPARLTAKLSTELRTDEPDATETNRQHEPYAAILARINAAPNGQQAGEISKDINTAVDSGELTSDEANELQSKLSAAMN